MAFWNQIKSKAISTEDKAKQKYYNTVTQLVNYLILLQISAK